MNNEVLKKYKLLIFKEGDMGKKCIKKAMIVFVLALSCLFFVFHDISHAAEDTKQESNVFTLGEIEVKDKSEPVKNITVERIDSEEMQEFNRDRLTDALNLLPGVTVSGTSQRNEQTVTIRGFGRSRAPVFLDGIPIYVPVDRTFDYNRFTTFDLSEITVSKGFTSVLYGPNTMGGAVNMITKRPVKSFEGTAGAGYATGNTYYGYVNAGTNQKKWYLQAGASYLNSDYFPMSNDYTPTTRQGGGRRIESYSKDDKVSFKVGLTPAEGHEYAFGFISQHGEKGGPPDTRPNGTTKYWTWPRWDKETYYVASRTPIGEKSYVKTRLYYDKLENWLDMFTSNTYETYNTKQGQRSYYDDSTVGGTIEAGTTLIPRNNIKAAFHYKRDTHNERNRMGSTATKNVYAPEPWQRSDDLTTSVGIEDTIDITKKFYAIAGISYDKSEGLRATEWSPSSVASGWFHYDTGSVSAWNPQVGLFYLLSDTGKLHASVAKKTNFPSMKEKFSGGFGTKIANPDLKPEKAINYEVGYEDVFLKKIKFKTNVFYNDITNAIQSVTVDAVAGTSQNQNIGKVKQFGIELEGIVSITNNLEWGGNYTYLNRSNETSLEDSSMKYIRLTDVPVHKIFSYVKYITPLKGLSLLGSVEYASSRTSSDDGIYDTGAYAVMNVKASYKVREGLTVEGGIKNALDRYYMYSAGYPEAGRIWFTNVSYKF
jgi:iron complex outermembrane receptor protein